MAFASTAPFDPRHPHALAFYCSDGRFTEAVEGLLHHLGQPRLDTITLPGGPALLNLRNAGFAELHAASSAVSFLVRSHAITHVYLLAHAGCGYYRARMQGAAAGTIAAAQCADLAIAAQVVLARHGDVHVETWFARPEGARVVFEPADSVS